MEKITLQELIEIAQNSKDDLAAAAAGLGRDVKVYLHWSAGHYGQFFDDYHVMVDQDGSVYISTEDLSEVKSHTWHRNTGAVAVALACAYKADTEDLGPEPPTKLQIEGTARVIAQLCQGLDLPCDAEHVMTHAEAADQDDYGPATTCERWDLWFFPGVEKGEGGNVLRGKAAWYMANGIDA